MKAVFVLVLGLGWNAHAVLGGRAAESEKDLPHLSHRLVRHQDNPSDCYSVAVIEGDGVGTKEYVNKATDTVFMIRFASRAVMSVQSLLKPDDFNELQHAKKIGTQVSRTLTRNHRTATTETPRLKVVFDDTQIVHRSIAISKADVPSCVTSPESLP